MSSSGSLWVRSPTSSRLPVIARGSVEADLAELIDMREALEAAEGAGLTDDQSIIKVRQMRLTVAAARKTSVAWRASQCDTNDAVYKHTRTSACDGCSCWATEFSGAALAGFGEYCALYASSAAGEARTRAMRSFLLDLLGMETLARLRSSLRSTTLRALTRSASLGMVVR